MTNITTNKLKTILTATIAVLLLATMQTVLLQAAKLNLTRSNNSFEVTHLKYTRVSGKFDNFSAEIQLKANNKIDSFAATVATKSINTQNAKRDNHLRSGDFFSAAKYKDISLKMLSEFEDSLTATLTIKGVSKEVTFEKKSTLVKSMRGQELKLELQTVINRLDFNVGTNFLAKTISEEVDITLSFQFIL